MALCFICDKPISETFMVCRGCADTYGLTVPFRQWPEWAKTHYQDKRKERDADEAGIERCASDLSLPQARHVERLVYGDPIGSEYE